MIEASWAPVNGLESPEPGSATGQTGGARPENRDAYGAPGSARASRSCGSRRRRDRPSASSLWSRAAIWAAALFAWLVFEPNRHPRAGRWDDPSLTRDLGWVTDIWARWDSVWFLRIAEHGYGAVSGAAAAFYPLYPLTLAGAGRVLGGHYVLAGVLVSLAAALASFVLLYRLAEDAARSRRRAAGGAVPRRLPDERSSSRPSTASRSTSPSSLAAFLLAERGAGSAPARQPGLAILTRISGVALLPALALIAWRRPDAQARFREPRASPRRSSPPTRCTSASPAATRSPSPSAQGFWNRHLSRAGPLGGIWDGLRSGWAGVQQLASGSHTHVYWTPVQDTDPMRAAAVNLEALAFLVLLVVLTVIAWRRFGAPYGLFCAVSLAIPLSVPSERWPLLSMPRFGLVLFPCFLALAVARRAAARAHRDPRRQLGHARRRRHPVGALAMGRVALARRRARRCSLGARLRRAVRADGRRRCACTR